MDGLSYCSRIAAPAAADFYYATRFTDDTRRATLTCLQAFWRETRDIVCLCTDPGVVLLKLQWWREELARTQQGHAQHPITQALHERMPELATPDGLGGILDAIETEIVTGVSPDYTTQAHWHARAGGRIWQLFNHLCGSQAEPSSINELAFGTELIDAIQNLHADIRAGRPRFPREALQAVGLDRSGLSLATPAGQVSRLCAIQAVQARKRLENARPGVRDMALPCLILARLAETLLKEMERDDYACLQRRESLTPLRKLYLAWRTWRRHGRGYRPTRSMP